MPSVGLCGSGIGGIYGLATDDTDNWIYLYIYNWIINY